MLPQAKSFYYIYKKLRLVLCAVFLILLVSGCWDRTEVNDTAFILITAMDKDENNRYRYSAMIPLPGQMGGAKGGGGGTSGNNSYYIETEVGSTFREAQEKLQKRMSRKIFHGHRRVIVVGESLAKEGITTIFDSIARMPENRLSTFPVVSKGDGLSLLKTQPRLEMFSAEAIRELAKAPGTLPNNMKDVSIAVGQNGNDAIIIYMGEKESGDKENPSKEVEVLGYAQFRDDKMVGIFENEQSNGLSLIKSPHTGFTANAITKDGQPVTYHVVSAKTKIKSEIRNGLPHFSVNVSAKMKLLESMQKLDLHNVSTSTDTENLLADSLRNSLHAAIRQIQKGGADSAAFGLKLSRSYPREWRQTYSHNWTEYLKKATFSYQIEVVLTETGLTYENISRKGGSSTP